MASKGAVAVLALLVGCGAPAGASFARIDRQDEVERIVWRDAYAMASAPPTVEWIGQFRLNCAPDDRGLPTGYVMAFEGGCFGGHWDGIAHVALPLAHEPGVIAARPPSQTAFAHEAMHQSLYENQGDADRAHQAPEWVLVAYANALLEAAHL
jgi:hypothetical protein